MIPNSRCELIESFLDCVPAKKFVSLLTFCICDKVWGSSWCVPPSPTAYLKLLKLSLWSPTWQQSLGPPLRQSNLRGLKIHCKHYIKISSGNKNSLANFPHTGGPQYNESNTNEVSLLES